MPAPLNPEPPVIDPAKAAVAAEAQKQADDLAEQAQAANAAFEAARDAHQKAQENAEAVYAREHAEEIAWREATALENHDRDVLERQRTNLDLDNRRKVGPPIDHSAIATFTIDGSVHQVIAIHGLMLDHKGSGDKARDANRYLAACGLSIDAPHDELVHDRFVQGEPDCKTCAANLKAMDAGEIEDRRGEYLTADEQIAFARAKQKEANRRSSERADANRI